MQVLSADRPLPCGCRYSALIDLVPEAGMRQALDSLKAAAESEIRMHQQTTGSLVIESRPFGTCVVLSLRA